MIWKTRESHVHAGLLYAGR